MSQPIGSYIKALTWWFSRDASRRRRVRQELARIAAQAFGDFPIGEDYKSWREDHQFLRDYQRLSPGNPYSQERKWNLRELVLSSNALTGDLAECGCYEGASAFFMATVSTHGSLCVFDSFQGISAPTEQDYNRQPDVMSWKKGDLRSAEETLRQNLEGLPIEVFSGWIPERFPEVRDRMFRLVHIDVDLYEPTAASLEFFYPRLVPGGYVVLDDYGFQTCPGARRAADEFACACGDRVIHLSSGQGLLIKRA